MSEKSKKSELVELVVDLAIGFLIIRFVEHTFPEQSFLVQLALVLLIAVPIKLAVHAALKFARRALATEVVGAPCLQSGL
ncbi:hypothetical protein [Ensifer sp.]|uniref:hypothetical protein n=1 Tax=Ensifer sp. TaxID=1872086 RepID=UPI002E12EDBF|nr:hypothetical protein [Ensifer sp.]